MQSVLMKMLHLGFYWVFTIIITACYTGSIIAFVTLPVFPETVDTIDQLQNGFYRVGTLDRGGWERWFTNSTQKETAKLLKNLEYVRNIEEGLSNVTKAYFLFPYAFVGSKSQLEYVIQTNYTNDKMLSRRSALHISDECFALFGVSYAFPMKSVYREKINNLLLIMQQAGLVSKLKNDVKWSMLRSSTGGYLQVSQEKTLKMTNQIERGLTLADTEGMFLLLGIGFLIAGGVLISEWVGGCTNKCMQFMKIKKERKQEEHRQEEEMRRDEEQARFDAEDMAREALQSASSIIGISFMAGVDRETKLKVVDHLEADGDAGSNGSSRHSRSNSSMIMVSDLNSAMLTEMYHGKDRPGNIVMINGKVMSEQDAAKYVTESKENHENQQRGSCGGASQISKSFSFLKNEYDDDEEDEDGKEQENEPPRVCKVEINLQAPSDSAAEKDIEDCFGEKVER